MAEIGESPFEHARDALNRYYRHGVEHRNVDVDDSARELVADLGYLIERTARNAATAGTKQVTTDPIAAWAQHLDDTAAYAGGFTDPERDGIRAAARMMRDPNVQAQVAKTVGGET